MASTQCHTATFFRVPASRSSPNQAGTECWSGPQGPVVSICPSGTPAAGNGGIHSGCHRLSLRVSLGSLGVSPCVSQDVAGSALWASLVTSQGVVLTISKAISGHLLSGWLSILVTRVISWGDAAFCPAAFSDSALYPTAGLLFVQPEGSHRGGPRTIWLTPFRPRGTKTPREPPSPLQKTRTERVPLFPVPTCPQRNVPWGPGRRVFKAMQNWIPTAGPITQPLQLGTQGQGDRRSQRVVVRKTSSDICKAPSQYPVCSRCLLNDSSHPKPNHPGAASAGTADGRWGLLGHGLILATWACGQSWDATPSWAPRHCYGPGAL